MTPERLAEIRARHAQATPGPWRWSGYVSAFQIDLMSVRTGNEVMGFHRWGMRGAQPVFCSDGILRDAKELLAPDTNPHRRRISAILHPDAESIAHSWQDVDELLAEVDRLRALLGEKTP